jgi:polyphosphate glucokinase
MGGTQEALIGPSSDGDAGRQPGVKSVLVIDVGGTSVKILATGQPGYDVVSIGYPGPVLGGRPSAEPVNLGRGWMAFDFAQAFGGPVKVMNDAAMQALGSYEGGKMLFLGLGTGLGTAFIADGVVKPMELGHLPYKKGTYEDYVGRAGLERGANAFRGEFRLWAGTDVLPSNLPPGRARSKQKP